MHLFIKLAFIVCPPLPDTGIRIAGSKQQESPLLRCREKQILNKNIRYWKCSAKLSLLTQEVGVWILGEKRGWGDKALIPEKMNFRVGTPRQSGLAYETVEGHSVG